MERVAPVAAPAVPSWRRAAVFFVATVAVVAVVSHAILVRRLESSAQQHEHPDASRHTETANG
jgi:invasion protein IalB